MFWVVLGIYILLTLLAVLVMFLIPQEGSMKVDHQITWVTIAKQVLSCAFATVFFYFTLNYLYNLFDQRRNYVEFIKACALAILLCVAYQAAVFYIVPELSSKPRDAAGLTFFSFAFAALFYVGLSLLISYLTYLRDEEKTRKVLEEQKMQLEVEKSQANFNFLKAQINPHFLHNTLNFLYAKSLPYSPELSEGILTLSDIMRYALSEGNAKDGKSPLKDEIEHVRNVIKINQLRFSNNLNVNFEVEGVINGAMIIPFVLITLVENAFKHGDVKSNAYPVTIRLKVDGHQMYFYLRNRKKNGPKELSTGIGLNNIKKRLDLAYGKNYSLDIKDEAEFYTTELTITQL